jgi:ABC-type sugar transport system substrate-binding protein
MKTASRFRFNTLFASAAIALGSFFISALNTAVAQDSGYTDGLREKYRDALKGKTVAFVPVAMGFDITQGYAAALQAHADKMGYKLVIRDPNWSVEQGVQAVQQLIAEKPDIIIAHPLDAQAMNRLVKKAADEGIYWIWANLKGGPNGDAFIGPDHYWQGIRKVEVAAKYCADKPSKKVALVAGPANNQAILADGAGIKDALALHPELKLVASQSADADANKAKSIVNTVLKQHPDLCAIIGQWDGEDIGIPPAVAEAGLKGKVAVITSGGGSKETACDKVADGSYYAYLSMDIGAQSVALNTAIVNLLQTKPKPGSAPYAWYVNEKIITPDNISSTHCWTVKELEQKAY